MKVSPKTNITQGHGVGKLRLGKEVCLCGNRAIKFKLSSWVCERCNRIEQRCRGDGYRNDHGSNKSNFYDVTYKCSLKFS